MSDEAPDRRSAAGRRQLLIMFGIAFATLAGAYVLYFGARSSGGWGTVNEGEFVDPPMQAGNLALVDFDGAAHDGEGKWWLWLSVERCETPCVETLEALRATHVLLNRDADRLGRALLVDDRFAQAEGFPRLKTLARPRDLPPGIYIVDPIGNLVFRYPENSPPQPVLTDLKRLLKLSQIG